MDRGEEVRVADDAGEDALVVAEEDEGDGADGADGELEAGTPAEPVAVVAHCGCAPGQEGIGACGGREEARVDYVNCAGAKGAEATD